MYFSFCCIFLIPSHHHGDFFLKALFAPLANTTETGYDESRTRNDAIGGHALVSVWFNCPAPQPTFEADEEWLLAYGVVRIVP